MAAVALERVHRAQRVRRCARAAARPRGSRSRTPPGSRAAPGRCWSARCDARRPRRAAPGSCRAAASCPPGRRTSRRTPRSCARACAGTRVCAERARAARAGAAGGSATRRSPATRSHSSRNGAATGSADGRAVPRARSAANDRDRGRDPHRAVRGAQARCVALLARSTSLDGFHSSSRRRVTSIRHERARDRVEADSTPRTAGTRASSSACASCAAPRRRDRAQVLPQRHVGGLAQQVGQRCGSSGGSSRIAEHDAASRATAGGSAAQPSSSSAEQRRPAPGCAAGCRGSSTRQRRERIASTAAARAGTRRQQPRRDLPVAADPAVAPADVGAVARRDSPRTAARR